MVTVSAGKDLHSVDTFSKQDPYVELRLKGADGTVLSTGKIKHLKRGGRNPVWAVDNIVALQYTAATGEKLTLEATALDFDAIGSDDVIGDGAADLTDLVGRSAMQRETNVELTRGDGGSVPAGTLCLLIDAAVADVEDGP